MKIVSPASRLAEQTQAANADIPSLATNEAKIANSLDSIHLVIDSLLTQLNTKIEELKGKTVAKLQSIKAPLELQQKLSKTMTSVSQYKMPSTSLKLSSLNSWQPSQLGSLSNIDLGRFSNINAPRIGSLSKSIPKVNVPGGVQPPSIAQNGYVDQAKAMASDPNQISELAEQKATDLVGVKDINATSEEMNTLKERTEQLQHPDSLSKEQLMPFASNAVNHFAGKEDIVREAMETLAKSREKIKTVENAKGLRKLAKSDLHDTPFWHRVVPGLAIQLLRKEDVFLSDFNVYGGYRITSKATAGLGWNQRVGYDLNHRNFTSDQRVFGPRVHGEYEIGRGFAPRVELEVMNTKVNLAHLNGVTDPNKREWVPGVFVGIKKHYRIAGAFQGTAMIMTRIYNPDQKSPYPQVLNIRFGFEIPHSSRD